MIRIAAQAGLKPNEMYALEVWEFNSYMNGCTDAKKADVFNAILGGYYASYYLSAGKKAKRPDEIINKIYPKSNQTFADGMAQIAKIKELEANGVIN